MKPITLKPVKGLRGEVCVPGDKSISHRAAICAALSCGRTLLENFSFCDDCLVTLGTFKAMGVKVKLIKKSAQVIIQSSAVLHRPKSFLSMGESGTSARILTGLLAAQDFSSTITGAPSLSKRPMHRVIDPLRRMGARLKARKRGQEEFLPMKIHASSLAGISWLQKIPSAQVKSAILLAGLFAQGQTIVEEPVVSRDHTERMLKLFGADIGFQKKSIMIRNSRLKTPGKVFIPGDISSASFLIVAALLAKNSRVVIKNVSINPTRLGMLEVLRRMGADIWVRNIKHSFEPMADLEASTSLLRGTVIRQEEIPRLIDELPILMVAASLAHGTTVIHGAEELRVKETDRIQSMVVNLMKLGANIKVKVLRNNITITIKGGNVLIGGRLKSFGDHRTAMSMCVAALVSRKPCRIDDVSCIAKSFPEFLPTLRHLFV
ncbi:MAG: 3-phosphoshikimate 1-carboxyvinyltransferase [Candidatus Omnitrophota bacterium]